MKLYYYRTGVRNFGDDLNNWLWPKLIPELLDPIDGYLLIGIGTILNRRIPESPQKVVFGAGVGYGERPVLDDSWTVYCVRGPLTAAALELSPDLAITDYYERNVDEKNENAKRKVCCRGKQHRNARDASVNEVTR